MAAVFHERGINVGGGVRIRVFELDTGHLTPLQPPVLSPRPSVLMAENPSPSQRVLLLDELYSAAS